jgi:hypothetical protein
MIRGIAGEVFQIDDNLFKVRACSKCSNIQIRLPVSVPHLTLKALEKSLLRFVSLANEIRSIEMYIKTKYVRFKEN